jgi:hypothetical protein
MRFLLSTFLSLLLLLPQVSAKNKTKTILPDYVLKARTVLVVVSPEAETSLLNPNENRTAREDVEKALMRWGRYTLVLEGSSADLVVAVRRGSKASALNPTIDGAPRDNRPVVVEGTDGAAHIGLQQGRPPGATDPGLAPSSPGPSLSTQVGGAEDALEVYRGDVADALDSSPLWRYMAKDALRSPNVPAVDQFRKTVEQAEKEAQKPSKKGP